MVLLSDNESWVFKSHRVAAMPVHPGQFSCTATGRTNDDMTILCRKEAVP